MAHPLSQLLGHGYYWDNLYTRGYLPTSQLHNVLSPSLSPSPSPGSPFFPSSFFSAFLASNIALKKVYTCLFAHPGKYTNQKYRRHTLKRTSAMGMTKASERVATVPAAETNLQTFVDSERTPAIPCAVCPFLSIFLFPALLRGEDQNMELN